MELKAKVRATSTRGVRSAEIDENGDLIFTMTDGETLNLGAVIARGIQGVEVLETGELQITYTDGTSEVIGDDVYSAIEALAERAESAAEAAESAAASLTLDDTLSIEGKAAESKATGNAIANIRNKAFTENEIRLDASGIAYIYLNPTGTWLKNSSPQRGFWKSLSTSVQAIRITASQTSAAYVGFLQSFTKNVSNLDKAKMSKHYPNRFTIPQNTSQEFLLYDDTKFLYVNTVNSGGTDVAPAKIETIALNVSIPETSAMSRAIQASLKNLTQPCVAMAGTLPMQNGETFVTKYYSQGTIIDGIVYSSVWRDGLDVYWNRNLETYYSAMANPASVLYTQNYTDKGISNAHAIMGGVCSSFISYLLNSPHYMRTDYFADILQDKTMHSLNEIEVGDILLRSGHIAMISQVYSDGNGLLKSVDITEQVDPIARTVNRRYEDLEGYLADAGYTVKANTFGKPRYLEYNGYATDIIFEAGNNTYVDLSVSNEMWFYIPETPAKVYFKKDNSAEYSEYTLSNAPQKTVNNTVVYNLAACFSGVGDYTLTTDVNNEKKCFLKIIKTGTIEIDDDNATLTLSGFENCMPKYYQMVPLSQNDGTHTSTAGNPPAGYYCSWDEFEPISGEYPQNIDHIPANAKFKLAIDYDTGLGYKRVFSANVGV